MPERRLVSVSSERPSKDPTLEKLTSQPEPPTALREFLNLHGTMGTKPRYRPTFYLIIVLATVAGVASTSLASIPSECSSSPRSSTAWAAPPLLLLIVLLAADRKVMRDRVSGPLSLTLTWAATILMSLGALALLATTVGIP
jgi:hypothetical protein